MPGDITGSLIYDSRTAEFTFREGPVFTNLMLADEINRTPPKTQAALLEAMEERQVTVDGTPRPLPDPFIVAATQNPVEYEGTYPLPEAQLDRFLMKIRIDLPERDAEIEVLQPARPRLRPARPRRRRLIAVAGPADLEQARREVALGDPPPAGAGLHRRRRPGHPESPVAADRGLAARRDGDHAHRPGLGLAVRAATTSPPTTSRRWPSRPCGTGSACGPRPSSKGVTTDSVIESILATVPGPPLTAVDSWS